MKNLIIRSLLLLLFTALSAIVYAQQTGDLDRSFNYGMGSNYQFSYNNGANGIITSTVLQSNGKILIGGGFSTYKGIARNGIARLNIDGSLDASFNPGEGVTGAFAQINSIAIQANGKILIGGSFTTYDGTNKNCIARLNASGTLDNSFDAAGAGITGLNDNVKTILIQSDGKILIGGIFTTNNVNATRGIARLNTNGSLDANFYPGVGADGIVNSIALQSDGKILIGGAFVTYYGFVRSGIARLISDGSLDESFNPTGAGVAGGYYGVNSVALQSDGKVLIGGEFTTYNETPRSCITRINTNGSLDTSFNPGTGVDNRYVQTIALQIDGKILIGGRFTSFNGTASNRIARLDTNGNLDTSFNPSGTSANYGVFSITLQPSGKILIGGDFTSYNGTTIEDIARLNSDGRLDVSFNPETGANRQINSIVLQSDRKILIGGGFTSFNGTVRNHLARLNIDGSIDNSFNPAGTGVDETIYSIILQSDGKILIGGSFYSYNGTPLKRIARLKTDGSIDTSFNPTGTGANRQIYSIALQPDGKILICGDFTIYNGVTINNIARLNSNGSLDNSFNPGTGPAGFNSFVSSIAVQSDGKILIGGGFNTYNGAVRNNIARLNPDGSLDTSFNPNGTGANGNVYSTTLQSDSKIMIGGLFTIYNGTSRYYIARLNTDGSLDASFNTTGSGANNDVSSITSQADGKILIGGGFTRYNGTSINYLARLNSDGSLDNNFNTGIGTNSYLSSIVLQTDGKVLIGGDFTRYGTLAAPRICRIIGSTGNTYITNNYNKSSIILYPSPANSHFTIEVSTPTTIQVVNSLGQVVLSQAVASTTEISTASLASGMYTVLAEGYKATSLVVSK